MPKDQTPHRHNHKGAHGDREVHTHSEACKPYIGTISQAPAWLRQPFILRGYRLCYSLLNAVASPWSIHNETVNIWTHLIPTILFTLDGLFYLRLWRSGHLENLYTLAKIVYPFSAAITLGASSLFHTCNCVSQDAHRRTRTIDLVGISSLILGTTWSVMHYTFHCHNELWYMYSLLLGMLSVTALVVPIIPYFHRDVFRVFRVLLHCSVAAGPLIMGIHAIRLWGIYSDIFTVLFSRVMFAYLSYLVGVFIYVLRIPERFFPGKFDLFGSSHQIWHCFVVTGAHFAYSGVLNVIEQPHLMICPVEQWP